MISLGHIAVGDLKSNKIGGNEADERYSEIEERGEVLAREL